MKLLNGPKVDVLNFLNYNNMEYELYVKYLVCTITKYVK